MFVGTINEADDKMTFLFLNDENNPTVFTYFKGNIQEVDEDTLRVLNCFKLGNNRKELGIEDGYQVIEDLDTNFKHYFKNGKEDYEKLYFCNGEDAVVYSPIEGKNGEEKNDSKARKFKTRFGDFLVFSCKAFRTVIVSSLLTATIIFAFASNSARVQYVKYPAACGGVLDIIQTCLSVQKLVCKK